MACEQTERETLPKGSLLLVGPLKVRAAVMACPTCDGLTRVHAIVATGIATAAGPSQGPFFVTGLLSLPASVVAMLELLAPSLVLAGHIESRHQGLLNSCQRCHGLLPDQDVFDGPESPFGSPRTAMSTDTFLRGRDLVVPEDAATYKANAPAELAK